MTAALTVLAILVVAACIYILRIVRKYDRLRDRYSEIFSENHELRMKVLVGQANSQLTEARDESLQVVRRVEELGIWERDVEKERRPD